LIKGKAGGIEVGMEAEVIVYDGFELDRICAVVF
jgi:hypothetical protein